MFLFKKIASRFLFPLPFCAEVLMLGLILLWFTRRQRAGKALVTLGAMLLLLLSYLPVSDALLRPLEYRYPPLLITPAADGQVSGPGTQFIVVLGGGATEDPRIPMTSRLSEDSLVRLAEGLRLLQALPGKRLILSGGGGSATAMANVAKALGVNQQDIILETESRDTGEEARFIAPTVGKTPFILVTSAAHMPRAMALFQKLGMKPIPAPTDFHVWLGRRIEPDNFFPGPKELLKSHIAVYEYLGLAWEELRGRI